MEKEILKSYLYPDNLREARRIQERLEQRVLVRPLPDFPRTVAGADAAFTRDKAVGVATLFSLPGLKPMEERSAVASIPFPYRTGFLSFREGPVLHEAILSLERKPDVILVDGQGIAHPKRLGLASFLGIILDIPAVGCAKSRLIGRYEEPAAAHGSRTDLLHRGEIVGKVLRTRQNVKPLFVSPGHLVDHDTAVAIVLACGRGFRIPEPLRLADRRSRELKKTV